MNQQTAAATTNPSQRNALKGLRVGVVVSDKRDKTRKVVTEQLAKHSKYGKYIRRSSQFQVHDENNESKLGDTVEIAPCRPLSKTKSWRLIRIVKTAPQE